MEAAEAVLMGEDVQVVLARLDGRMEALTQIVQLRMQTQERDLEAVKLMHSSDHKFVLKQLEDTNATVSELKDFKSRLIGMAVGLSLASGTISGLMVTLLTGGNGG